MVRELKFKRIALTGFGFMAVSGVICGVLLYGLAHLGG